MVALILLLVGCTSDPALDGSNGIAGSNGVAGIAGSNGAAGPAGAPGAPGVTGQTGPAGIQGPAGPTGADGPEGPQGLAGLDGELAQFKWYDATGVQVTTGPELIHIEPNGDVWDLDIETGAASWPTVSAFFDGSMCGGDAFIESHPPRRPFSVTGDPATIYVRPDAQAMPGTCSFVTTYQIVGLSPTCQDLTNGTCLDGLLDTSQMGITTAPALPWIGPLHQAL